MIICSYKSVCHDQCNFLVTMSSVILYVPAAIIADTSADGVMDSVNQSLCLYHIPGGKCSVLSSVSSLVVYYSISFFFFFFSKRFYDQLTSGFRNPNFSGFYTSVDSGFQSSGFRIPKFKISWIPDSGFVTWGKA